MHACMCASAFRCCMWVALIFFDFRVKHCKSKLSHLRWMCPRGRRLVSPQLPEHHARLHRLHRCGAAGFFWPSYHGSSSSFSPSCFSWKTTFERHRRRCRPHLRRHQNLCDDDAASFAPSFVLCGGDLACHVFVATVALPPRRCRRRPTRRCRCHLVFEGRLWRRRRPCLWCPSLWRLAFQGPCFVT